MICDSSSLITLVDSGLLGCLISLKKYIGKIYITPYVVVEAIERPLNIPAHSYSAVRLKRALNTKVFEILQPERKSVEEILTYFNSLFLHDGRKMELIHYGEAEVIAAAIEKKINYVLIDERTTRAIVEDPYGLKDHLSRELNEKISLNNYALEKIKSLTRDLKFIRSAEIVALAYEKKYFKKFNNLERKAFESALYATKFQGCAISFDEINEIMKVVK